MASANESTTLAIRSSSTGIEVMDFSLTWTINDFLVKNWIRNRQVPPRNLTNGCWQGSLYHSLKLHRKYRTSSPHLQLTLMLLCSRSESLAGCQLEVSILNAEKQKAYSKKVNCPTNTDSCSCFWIIYKFIDRDFLLNKENGLLPDDKLTILCEGSSASETTYIIDPSAQLKLQTPEYKLAQDLGSLFENEELSDVTVSAGGRDFHVHKAILAARSPVFAAMFKHQLKETMQNRVVITDVDYRVLEKMLAYIYTGRLQNFDMVEELFVAADKYNLSGLKVMCENGLCSTVTVESTVNLLVLADMHSSKCLKKKVYQFIKKHVRDIIKTPAWDRMKSERPHLAVEALEAIFLSK